MFDDLLDALGRVSEGITPDQRDAGKVAMAKAAVARSNPFGKKVTDKSPKTFVRKVAKDDSESDPLALKVKSAGKITRAGRIQKNIDRSRKISNPNIPGLKPGQTESESMFDDLLEAWDYMEATANRKEADPTALRLGHRLAKGITRQSREQPAGGPPPTPGTPAHAKHRRGNLFKSLGMKMVGGDKKKPPPAPIPSGTKIAGIDLVGSKEESFFSEEFALWEARTKKQQQDGLEALAAKAKAGGAGHSGADASGEWSSRIKATRNQAGGVRGSDATGDVAAQTKSNRQLLKPRGMMRDPDAPANTGYTGQGERPGQDKLAAKAEKKRQWMGRSKTGSSYIAQG